MTDSFGIGFPMDRFVRSKDLIGGEKIDFLRDTMRREDFDKNDMLKVEKIPPYSLMVKSTYSGVVLNRFVYLNHDSERHLFQKILEDEKFKNIRVDENLISLMMYTDNTIFKRKLFYPAFFIDVDFKFDERFVVKGIMVFECHTIKKSDKETLIEFGKDVNDTRIHFCVVDKRKIDITSFGISFNDISNNILQYAETYILSDYQDENKAIIDLLENVVRITCNIIDMIEGNKEDLEIKTIIPPSLSIEKRIKKGKSPITTTVIIKPKKELLAYIEAFEREHRKLLYSHKFVVRGHWRHFRDEKFVNMFGKKTWIRPFIKGEGILIKKDARVVEGIDKIE